MKNTRYKLMLGIAAVISLIIIISVIILPPGGGKLSSSGYRDGLSERVNLDVDGGTLGLMLISENTDNPVLLFCGGGPGIPQYLLEDIYGSPLSEMFTVCYWDYRGTGASYSKDIVPGDMTADRYIKDALAVTDYLSRRFSQDRIYIMGHSFGTYIALNTVQMHPEKYVCYIAMSQVCDQTESEYLAFDYMKQQYIEAGNKSMADRFEKYDIRSSAEDYSDYFFSGLRDKAMHDLGIGTARNMRSVITGIFFPSLRCKAYTQSERINIWKGKALSSQFPVTQDAIGFNAFKDAESVDIPVFFIVGKYDYTCCASLQREYYDSVKAPVKDIYIFEDSAHSPIYEEHEHGREVLADIKSKCLN